MVKILRLKAESNGICLFLITQVNPFYTGGIPEAEVYICYSS
ncbi:hypothetical protein FLA_6314 [Filimonas lacunae]|nr:hypothetical protein FLA_6314 [Filimonas lacunae]